MIVTAHLLCGGGGGVHGGVSLYNDNTTAHFAMFGSMIPQENLEKKCHLVHFCLYLDQVFNIKVMILTGHALTVERGGGGIFHRKGLLLY